jgi:uncharacterized protein (TIGR02271 family)
MSRTVTALYETRSEAEAARQRLSAALDLTNTRIIDQETDRTGSREESLNRVPMPHEDRAAYSEGIRRGGFMLTADVRGHEDADTIIRLLEDSAGIDIDSRQQQWRREGWSPQPAPSSGSTNNQDGTSSAEERIPIVDEQLAIGKREVERGGARVRSYVREVPVHEQVTLREEHVSVERRPLDQRLSAEELERSDLLRERDVQVTAMAEEPVVQKEARVREEVVVRKAAELRTQQVDETLARTEVDVDGGDGRSAFAGFEAQGTAVGNIPSASGGVTLMAQDNLNGGGSRAGFGGATGTTGATSTTSTTATTSTGGSTIGGSQSADTLRPTGGTAAVDTSTLGYQEGRSSYQPGTTGTTGTELTVIQQRRPASRPSRSLVIGSALAGAIAGSALPFMLAGRKSASRSVEVDAGRREQGIGGVEVDAARSNDPSTNDRDPASGRTSGRRRS